LMGIFQNNAGGAWDNAKKSFEAGVLVDGKMEYKGSEPHKASVTGDTVGDPFKDTSGPSMNILIKLMSIVSLVIAPFIMEGDVQNLETAAPELSGIEGVEMGEDTFIKEGAVEFTLGNNSMEVPASVRFRQVDAETMEKVEIRLSARAAKELFELSFPDTEITSAVFEGRMLKRNSQGKFVGDGKFATNQSDIDAGATIQLRSAESFEGEVMVY